MVTEIDAEAVKSGFDAFRSAIETLKSARGLFKPGKPERNQIDQSIETAEKELALAEAQIAQALGYELCKAHFPPVPMLKDRVHAKYVEDIWKCPECGLETPPPEYFSRLEEQDRYVEDHNARAERDWSF